MRAMVTPSKFSELFTRFQNTYGDLMPPVVMYYRENGAVNCYLQTSEICFECKVSIDEASKFLSIFSLPIELTERYY